MRINQITENYNPLQEGPLVLNRPSDVLRMLDTLLAGWKSKDHSDEEMAQLLKALGYKMDKKGDRTVLVQEDDLDEAPGAIRKGLAAVALIAGLWGVNNHMAQQAYDASPQLQKLTAYLEVAQEHNDQRMIKQLEQRIENHKTRLDIGKGEVMGKDGRPIDVSYDKDIDEAGYKITKNYAQMIAKQKRNKPSLGQSKLSSAEYQHVKKLQVFNKDDWKWNADEQLYHRSVKEGEKHGNSKEYDQCWDGYKKVPGKQRGEKGSCVKESFK